MGSNYISWSSRKQPTVSCSSIEVKYRALASPTAEVIWIAYLLHDLSIPLSRPPQLLCDNISDLHLTLNPVLHAHAKHIELNYHFIQEKVAKRDLITCYIPFSFQIVDILMKALPQESFLNYQFKLGVHPFPFPLPNMRGLDRILDLTKSIKMEIDTTNQVKSEWESLTLLQIKKIFWQLISLLYPCDFPFYEINHISLYSFLSLNLSVYIFGEVNKVLYWEKLCSWFAGIY